MPKKRFTNEQIAFALRQAENGTLVGEICRKMGVAEATFYRWKKVYAGMGVSEIRRLKQLEEENAKLKRLVADLSLDKTMLQDGLQKSGEARPASRGKSGTFRWRSPCRSAGPARPAASDGPPIATSRAATRLRHCACG